MIQIGIDSFAKKYDENQNNNRSDDERVVSELVERIEFADNVGINVFGVGGAPQERIFRFRSTHITIRRRFKNFKNYTH